MIVRHLRPNDIDNTAILMSYYRDDLHLSDEEWNEDILIQSLKRYAIGGDHCCLLALEGNRVVGGLFGSIRSEFFNADATCVIHFIFLLPTHRTESNYQYLFDEFKKWTDRFGAEKFVLVDLAGTSRRLVEISDILGFQSESLLMYVKEIA